MTQTPNKTFSILIARQSRVVIAIFVFAILFVVPILVSTSISSTLLSIFFVVFAELLLLWILMYFAYARLQITVIDNNFFFEWRKKALFNYTNIENIGIHSIKKIVLDRSQIIRKIYADDREIPINNLIPKKWMHSDSKQLIEFLIAENKTMRILDSWDDFQEKGFLHVAYKINSVLLTVAVIAVLFVTITKGFSRPLLGLLILIVPQLFLYQSEMKAKRDQSK